MLVSFRIFSACIVLSVISGIQLQAQKATCSFNTRVLNPNNPSNPAAFATGVNDNRTVVGAATYYFNKPNSSGFVHYFSGKITYWRDGQSHDVDVKLGKLPTTDQQASKEDDSGKQKAQPSSLDDFGLALGPSDDKTGVVITDVDPNGQAAERGLQPGDVILSVGEAKVTAPADVEKKVADAKAGGQKAILLRVKSGDQTRYVALSFARA